MADFKVAEVFTSVNGEGARSGQLALFIRMGGCNLKCEYCDTGWTIDRDAGYQEMSTGELLTAVRQSGIRNVTLTGGEPLLQEGIGELISRLTDDPLIRVEIETNGSIRLAPIIGQIETEMRERVCFNMDYKLPGSGMEHRMHPANFDVLGKNDTVKFVVRDRTDLALSLELIADHDLTDRCRVFLSPVYGEIEPAQIVDFMKEHRLNDVTLQLQMHKIIWGGECSGV